jgi:hypothetical protein
MAFVIKRDITINPLRVCDLRNLGDELFGPIYAVQITA